MASLTLDVQRRAALKKIHHLLHADVQKNGLLLISGVRGVGKSTLVDDALTTPPESALKKPVGQCNILRWIALICLIIWRWVTKSPRACRRCWAHTKRFEQGIPCFGENIIICRISRFTAFCKIFIRKIGYRNRPFRSKAFLFEALVRLFMCVILAAKSGLQLWRLLTYEWIAGRTKRKEERLPRKVKRIIIKVNVDANFPNQPDQPGTDENSMAYQLLRNVVFSLTNFIDARLGWRAHGRVLLHRIGFVNYFFSTSAYRSFLYWVLLGALVAVVSVLTLQLKIPLWVGFSACALGAFLLGVVVSLINWRAAANMSSYLYDLVHAQDMSAHNHQHVFDMNMRLQGQKQGVVVVFALVFGAVVMFLLSKEIALILQNPITVMLSVLGLLGGGLALHFNMSSTQKKRHAHFGQGNPVWMVTLLRRYLFILHQCGIEPVLVFDELDKLELELLQGSQVFNPGYPSQALAPKLRMFVETLFRLRDSLGAHFLCILISGPALYKALLEERVMASGGMGPLATLVNDNIFLGPIDPKSVSCRAEIWLEAQGLFANIARLNSTFVESQTDTDAAQQMQRWIQALWRWEAMKDALHIKAHLTPLIDGDWTVNWMRQGMIRFALRLNGAEDNPTHQEMLESATTALRGAQIADSTVRAEKTSGGSRNVPLDDYVDDYHIALLSGAPEPLMALGAYILYNEMMNSEKAAQIGEIQLDRPIRSEYYESR